MWSPGPLRCHHQTGRRNLWVRPVHLTSGNAHSDTSSSEVHKAIQKATKRVVALKRIMMHNEKEGMPVTALREIKILKSLKHHAIIDLVDMFIVRSKSFSISTLHFCLIIPTHQDKDKEPFSVYMVFPYMDHDLAGLLENDRLKLQSSHIKLYMKQLLEGTHYMHQVPAQWQLLVIRGYC